MKQQVIYFPIYHIFSDLVKTAIGVNSSRSIERFFRDAGIKVHDISGKKCVTCEDLLALGKDNKQRIMEYEPQSDLSRELFEMFK